MEKQPLPESGPQRKIFLRALRLFSDSCEAPLLTPECPFRTAVAPGQYGCGDECLDLLAEHGDDDVHDDALHVSERVRRPRRGPDADARPFDAQVIYCMDEKRPRREWRTSSLLFELKNRVTYGPLRGEDLHARDYEIKADAEELERRGLDVERLIRDGMRRDIAVSIVMATALSRVMDDPEELPAETPVEWHALLDEVIAELLAEPTGDDDDHPADSDRRRSLLFKAAFTKLMPLVVQWVADAPIVDIFRWACPSDLEVSRLMAAPSVAPDEHAIWMVDRFTSTYIRDWSESSLHLEWQYQRGELKPPCPVGRLKERPIDLAAVNALIAERAVKDERTNEDAGMKTADFTSSAVTYLRAGDQPSAATIFRSILHVRPDDAEAQNNLGFCLIFDSPVEALQLLEQAADVGFEPIVLNSANRMLALFLLGRHATALELAEQTYTRYFDRSCIGSYVWQFDGDLVEPVVIHREDVRGYLLELAEHIARIADSGADVALWAARRQRHVAESE